MTARRHGSVVAIRHCDPPQEIAKGFLTVHARQLRRACLRRGGIQSKLAEIGRFFRDRNRGSEVELPRNVDNRSQCQYEYEPNGSSTTARPDETVSRPQQTPRIPMNPLDRLDGPPKRDVECDHPYYNVHYTSLSGDARTLAALRG
ncbi:unnamed protein product [Heligmosomoides polygyrus]|uniref:Uncharacterized protein n=1 Tax=Heligmosomoides polygyrus TaxID=6339 RepID=A0A183FS80_HELPZ|nr:unnamed protein product [Heligmosomoides polygyrus]